MLCVLEAVLLPAVVMSFRLSVGSWPLLLLVLLLGNVGISSVGTLFSAAVAGAGAAGSLLAVVVMVLLAPFMIPAVFAMLSLFGAVPARLAGTGNLAFVGSLRAAIGYMAAFDVLFVTVCRALFGFVVRD
jgi:heme exporter protein B